MSDMRKNTEMNPCLSQSNDVSAPYILLCNYADANPKLVSNWNPFTGWSIGVKLTKRVSILTTIECYHVLSDDKIALKLLYVLLQWHIKDVVGRDATHVQ